MKALITPKMAAADINRTDGHTQSLFCERRMVAMITGANVRAARMALRKSPWSRTGLSSMTEKSESRRSRSGADRAFEAIRTSPTGINVQAEKSRTQKVRLKMKEAARQQGGFSL